MNIKYFSLLLLFATITIKGQNTKTLVPLPERVNIQADSAKANQIIDEEWVAVGTSKPYTIQHDYTRMFNGKPSYRFELKQTDNTLEGYATGETKGRAELSYCYATTKDFTDTPADTYINAQKMKTVYHHGKGFCPQGSSKDYEFSIYVPSELNRDVSTIFAQWHGMPDRRLVSTPDGEVKMLTVDEFLELYDRMIFKKNMGHDRATGKPNGWLIEQGGYPPMAFGFSGGWFYIKTNSDRKWLTDKTDRCNASPEKTKIMQSVTSEYKASTIAYKMPFDQFPKNCWVTFRIHVEWTGYSGKTEQITKPGRLDVLMNYTEANREISQKIVDNEEILVGRNDDDGYYFKFGIYRVGNSTVPVCYNLAAARCRSQVSMRNVLTHDAECNQWSAFAKPGCSASLPSRQLMHEMRETPSPLNNAVVSGKAVSFMWPLKFNTRIQSGLDGMEGKSKISKPDPIAINYRIRLSKDPNLQKEVITAALSWPFYNPDKSLTVGKWYWQYGYVKDGKTEWSGKLQFTVKDNSSTFSPPSYRELITQLPQSHPRILVFEREWDKFIKDNKNASERKWYTERADQALKAPIVHLPHAIDTSKVGGLDNEVKKNALLTRESRRIVDREEANIDALIRAYAITKNRSYYTMTMKRIEEMITWKRTPYFVGDFNWATLLSICSMAYDTFYQELSDMQKKMLLKEIKENGTEIFNGFANHLENHIADNHNWQMNLRIFTFAAFATYGELPEAEQWTNYCYNLWLARFPGLNNDGGWHNGDSYFHVNIRTLVEVPYFYSRVTGYNYFSDPWYNGSAMYVMYQQPPFSKSGGNGSSHQNVVTPSGTRVAYADALARLTQNTYLADYVRTIAKADPDIMKKGFMAKPGDLSWFRLQCHTPLPEGKGLKDLPLSYVFPQTGLASFMSDWGDIKLNAMLSFRSSPYGSTSHALANQNAFNTFYAGKPLFYSSGHHISFTDEHSVYCHRATRAHNTVLVNGMGQRIGTEGYGWIPRYYNGEKISYVVGDASNAYGEVISPLWLKRGEQSKLEYSPQNGWDKNHLKTFRRHIVELDGADLIFIYDELEADTPVTWDYLLHTTENPMTVISLENGVHIKATNGEGISDAYLFANDKLETKETDQFFYPAENWLRADDKGYFAPYKNHWHFTASTPKKNINRFATIISTHNKAQAGITPTLISGNAILVGDWTIRINLSDSGKATFSVENIKDQVSLIYDDSTVIQEKGKKTVLKDEMPELEI